MYYNDVAFCLTLAGWFLVAICAALLFEEK